MHAFLPCAAFLVALVMPNLANEALAEGSEATSPAAAKAAIEATIRDYIEGWYEGDAARMESALHDELAKRIPVVDSESGQVALRAVTKERMVELTEGGGGESPGSEYEIIVHHVYGNIASASARSLEYFDLIHLVETSEGWKIANILFRKHE